MKNLAHTFPTTRREFLRLSTTGIGLLAFSRFAPAFLVQSTASGAPTPEKDRRILVLVQLAGGNDGLNTVIPYQDPNYFRLRPNLSAPAKSALKLNDAAALHPACQPLHELLGEGKLGIVQNVGYPNPNRSHFRSTDIWESASGSDEVVSTGWIGRYLDNACAGAPEQHDPLAVHVSNEVPTAFLSDHPHPTFGVSQNNNRRRSRPGGKSLLEDLVGGSPSTEGDENASYLRQTMMDALVTERRVQDVLGAYKAAATYPNSAFAQSLQNVAALIAGGLPTRVYFVSLSGFDTHANQLGNHQNLLATLSAGLAAFQKDLEKHGLADQVLTMTFSEFGRRPMENESRGTDHGTAAPLFVLGSKVKAGLHGTAPNLEVKRNQDLTFSTDFRQVYSTVLSRWLDCPPDKVLGRAFDPIPFV
jgi:uncharacterized protein (DUF1501 family)